MDSWSTFQHNRIPIKTDGGTRTESVGAKWLQSNVQGGPERQIRRFVRQEKPLRRERLPYHKPTQVDEMNILRRSGDGVFRN